MITNSPVTQELHVEARALERGERQSGSMMMAQNRFGPETSTGMMAGARSRCPLPADPRFLPEFKLLLTVTVHSSKKGNET